MKAKEEKKKLILPWGSRAPIAAFVLGIGAVFFYLMSQPNNAPKIAHATGQNLPELTGRDTVSKEDGTRMGTHRSS